MKMAEIDTFLENAIKDRVFPGCVLGVIRPDGLIYSNAYGYLTFEKARPMSEGTIFDLASLSKVVATTTSIMHLIDRGIINLYDYLYEFFPEVPDDKKGITVYHLLTHSSGLQAIVQLWNRGLSNEEKIEYLLNLKLKAAPGEQIEYSDPNFILLGELVKRASGKRLDQYTASHIFQPLGMGNTAFNPLENLAGVGPENFAPTEKCGLRGKVMCGEVHDENAYFFSGISGHAGLFSTVTDLAKFVQMLLNNGKWKDKMILSSQVVNIMRKNWTEGLNVNRGLGWDLKDNYRSSSGVLMSDKSFGHTGFTGTSIWIDPEEELGIILLSNRVHPTRENVKIISLRPRLHNLIVQILTREGVL